MSNHYPKVLNQHEAILHVDTLQTGIVWHYHFIISYDKDNNLFTEIKALTFFRTFCMVIQIIHLFVFGCIFI